MTAVSDKPALDDALLLHYGVAGMKWGKTRVKASGKDIKRARRSLEGDMRKYGALEDKLGELEDKNPRKATAADKKIEAKLKKMDDDFAKDPRRVVAQRTTRGEKAAIVILGGPFGVALVAGLSGVNRRIEYKQDNGKYDKK